MSGGLFNTGELIELHVPDNANPSQVGFRVCCNRLFGGAPLHWYKRSAGVELPLVWEHAGAGCNLVFDTGQDGTHASATGMDWYPVARYDTPSTWPLSYYAQEIEFNPVAKRYITESFAPYFWTSQDPIDDLLPPDPRGDHRWSMKYHDILNKGPGGYDTFGAPIFFAGTGRVPSGIILLGDEIRNIYKPNLPWGERIAKLPAGRFALKCRVCLQKAGADAVASFMLRRSGPFTAAMNIHNVWASPGLFVNINKAGLLQVTRNGVVIFQTQVNHAALNSAAGVWIEIKTENQNNNVQIIADNQYRGSFSDTSPGEYFGLFASCTSGVVEFSHRNFIDVGFRCRFEYQVTARNTLRMKQSIQRVAPPWSVATYRLQMPVIFLHKDAIQGGHYYDKQKQLRQVPASQMVQLNQVSSFWIGRTDRSRGLFCKIITNSGGNAGHLLLQHHVAALNPLSFNANITPEYVQSHVMETEWSPVIRADLL